MLSDTAVYAIPEPIQYCQTLQYVTGGNLGSQFELYGTVNFTLRTEHNCTVALLTQHVSTSACIQVFRQLICMLPVAFALQQIYVFIY